MAIKHWDNLTSIQPDRHSGALITTDYLTYATHEGAQFTISHNAISLAASGTIGIVFTVPTGYHLHVKHLDLWGMGAPHLFTFYPFVSSFTAGGSSKTPRSNIVSLSAPVSIMGSLNLNPTAIVTAAPTLTYYFGGGTGIASTSSSGIYSPSSEYIIESGNHIAEISNLSGAVANVQMSISWLELENE